MRVTIFSTGGEILPCFDFYIVTCCYSSRSFLSALVKGNSSLVLGLSIYIHHLSLAVQTSNGGPFNFILSITLPLYFFPAVKELIEHPYKTRSDSFYFVEGTLIMHNKADYAYNADNQ